jgi:hypothetical protein
VSNIKESYHPNAYLQHVKNVRSGLAARTKLLNLLDQQAVSAGTLARNSKMSYAAAIHHLWLLEAEETVNRRGKRPCVWVVTGMGQKRLVS